MFKEKPDTQIFEENEKEKYSEKELKEMIKMEIEISGRDNEKENRIMKISEELRNTIIFYLCNKFKVKGVKEGEELSLCFYGGDLYLNAFDPKLDPASEVLLSWLIEDEKIIKEIEELIS